MRPSVPLAACRTVFAAVTAFVADLLVAPALMTVASRGRQPAAETAPAD
jgi:hypothetical protein